MLFLFVAMTSFEIRAAETLSVGVAGIDITPEKPIRLNGYGSRSKPSEGVAQKLFAKALAIGGENPVVLITADLIGIPKQVRAEVAGRLRKKVGLPPDRLALCATHTHTGPTLKGVLENIFMAPIPPEQMKVIEEYTAGLVDKLESVAIDALNHREPGNLDWGIGSVDFAVNRRSLKDGKWTGFGEAPEGPVDHDLPMLRVTGDDGKVRAILINYACHCTTLGGDYNQVHGDWAGRAAELIEENLPGATVLIAIGCGADANPLNRGQFESIEPHARKMAAEVDRLLAAGKLKPVRSLPKTMLNPIDLRFDPLPARQDWEALAADEKNRFSFYGRKMLAGLDRGEKIANSFAYPIQSWTFGDDLAMIFLPGEVVVDYSLRLKKILDRDRIWINAYANEAPCYIASRRLYDEGGYEVDRSMWYYDKPTRLSPETEERIIAEILRQLPESFRGKKN